MAQQAFVFRGNVSEVPAGPHDSRYKRFTRRSAHSRSGEAVRSWKRQGVQLKKAVQVLAGAAKAIKTHYISFTPDGPCGPKYVMSRGPDTSCQTVRSQDHPCRRELLVILGTQELGSFPDSWPWAKITLALGESIFIPPDLSEEELEKWREKLKMSSEKYQ